MNIVKPEKAISPRRMRAIEQRAYRHGLLMQRVSPTSYFRATFYRAIVAHVVDVEANKSKYDVVRRIKEREDNINRLYAELERVGKLHERGAR